MFPQGFPQGENGGETKSGLEAVQTPVGIEPMTPDEKSQPSLNKIWELFGSLLTIKTKNL